MSLPANIADMWGRLDNSSRLKAGCAVIFILAAALAWSALATGTADLERKRAAREAVLKEILPLKATYKAAKMSADQLRGRMAGVRTEETPAQIFDEIGIRGKGVKVVPARREEKNGVIEETADVRIDGLTANEALNLIYRLEKGGRPIRINKTGLRVRFDDPSRFDLFLTIALLKPGASGK